MPSKSDLLNDLYPRLVLASRTEVGVRIQGAERASLAAVFLAELQGVARRSGLYYVASPGWNDPKTRQDKTRQGSS